MPFYGWHYPPFFLGIAALVATVPYGWGLGLWLVASFAAYLAAIRTILPRRKRCWWPPPFLPSSSMSVTAITDF